MSLRRNGSLSSRTPATHEHLQLRPAGLQGRPALRMLVQRQRGKGHEPVDGHRRAQDVEQFHGGDIGIQQVRSEDHTSELQSLMRISYAVFCLKKKKTT